MGGLIVERNLRDIVLVGHSGGAVAISKAVDAVEIVADWVQTSGVSQRLGARRRRVHLGDGARSLPRTVRRHGGRLAGRQISYQYRSAGRDRVKAWHGPSPMVNCNSSYIRARGSLSPSVALAVPSNSNETAAASTPINSTHAGQVVDRLHATPTAHHSERSRPDLCATLTAGGHAVFIDRPCPKRFGNDGINVPSLPYLFRRPADHAQRCGLRRHWADPAGRRKSAGGRAPQRGHRGRRVETWPGMGTAFTMSEHAGSLPPLARVNRGEKLVHMPF